MKRKNPFYMHNDPELEKSTTKPPLLSKKIINFAKAVINHELKGRPQCTEDEINERFNICKNCEMFRSDGESGVCTHIKCGCNINKKQIYLNKLAWADQECPIKKWKKVAKTKQNPENGV